MLDLRQLEEQGFAITEPLLSSRETNSLLIILEQQTADESPRRGGLRDVLDNLPAMSALALHPAVHAITHQVLGTEAFLVRSTLFDKTEAANWKVPWHQDVTIAVKERHDTDGFGPWSIKSGVTHVQPPTSILARMLTIRIHLDACPAANGALRVMPGTHRLGRLNQNHVDEHVNEDSAVTCEAKAGGALVMRPLLLHSSSQARIPAHRRVLHFDFAADTLPNGLAWKLS